MQPEPRVGRLSSIISVVVAAVLIFGTVSARATTYYVSESSGDDSWTGRAPSPAGGRSGPWKTLGQASTHYDPGDRILLKCGDTWNEELHPLGSGTPTDPIVIGSYGTGNKPIIDRQDYNIDRVGVRLDDQGGYKIAGIEFARCMTGIYAEYSDGCPTKEFLQIEDCDFRDSLKYDHYETYPTPRNIGLGVCLFSYERDNRIVLQDITLKNCTFRRLASGVWTNSPDNFNYGADFIYNFENMTMDNCLFEEGLQWQMGIRGVDGGLVRNCVTHDIGRDNYAWNGVAGAMFFRSKNWVFEDSEWGTISRGLGSGDGEAFDFEGNCDDIIMRRCLFHDTDGPGFLICLWASTCQPNRGIVMEDCVLNGKSMWSSLPRSEIFNTAEWANDVTWDGSRFYLSSGEVLQFVQDPWGPADPVLVNYCSVKNLSDACSTPNQAAGATASASSQETGSEAANAIDGDDATFWEATSDSDQWLELDLGTPTAVKEFKIKEDASSSIVRYTIEYWDDEQSEWVSCFNGRTVGADFMAPIVARTMQKVRLSIAGTTGGTLRIGEFEVYPLLSLVWDADTGTADAQDGDGTWIQGGNKWNGSGNVAWDNAEKAIATFGAGNATADPTVTVDTVIAGGIVFDDANGHKYTLSGGTITLALAGGATIKANVDACIASVIDGTTGLIKAGAGTLELTGENTYDGGTTINAGTLLVNNTTGSGTGTGAVTVASGATLGGTGAITGDVTINSGGTLAPGASVGTLTVNNDLTFEDGGNTWIAELLGAAADRVTVTGDLTLGDGTALEFVFDADNPFQAGTYTLASYDTRDGEFSSVTSLGAYSTGVVYGTDAITIELLAGLLAGDANLDGKTNALDYVRVATGYGVGSTWTDGDVNGDGAVNALDYVRIATNYGAHTPEPATLALLAMGGAWLAFRKRRHGTKGAGMI